MDYGVCVSDFAVNTVSYDSPYVTILIHTSEYDSMCVLECHCSQTQKYINKNTKTQGGLSGQHYPTLSFPALLYLI